MINKVKSGDSLTAVHVFTWQVSPVHHSHSHFFFYYYLGQRGICYGSLHSRLKNLQLREHNWIGCFALKPLFLRRFWDTQEKHSSRWSHSFVIMVCVVKFTSVLFVWPFPSELYPLVIVYTDIIYLYIPYFSSRADEKTKTNNVLVRLLTLSDTPSLSPWRIMVPTEDVHLLKIVYEYILWLLRQQVTAVFSKCSSRTGTQVEIFLWVFTAAGYCLWYAHKINNSAPCLS